VIQGLIFDFDGLILDTETPIFQSWREIFEQHGCAFTLKMWAECIGRSPDLYDRCDLLESCVGRPVDRAAIHRMQRQRESELIDEQPLLPGVRQILEEAARLELRRAIASSSSREWVSRYLKRFELVETFAVVRCADDVAQAKPAPDLYLAVLEALALRADEVIALEDSPNGVTAAKRAGIFCVAVPNALTSQLPLDHADLRLSTLDEISLARLLEIVIARQNRA